MRKLALGLILALAPALAGAQPVRPVPSWLRYMRPQVIPGSPFGGGGGGGMPPFSDALNLVRNASDATKTFKVDVSGLTTGNPVTMTLSGTTAAPTWTATGWTLNIGNGVTASPAIAWAADADGSGTGWYRSAANQWTFVANGTDNVSMSGTLVKYLSTSQVGWTSGAPTAALDTAFRRLAAGVVTHTTGTATSIGTLIGGGANVASADPLPAPTGNVFHVTGTTSFTNITTTNLISGACFTMIFDGILNITDGGNLKLTGNLTTSADDTLHLCFDGTNFYQVGPLNTN